MSKAISTYEQQAIDFLTANKIEFSAKFTGHRKHFQDDKEERDTFKVQFLKRVFPLKTISFDFGQSINNSTGDGRKKPTAYDVITCLTKSDPGHFQDFCSEYGYDEDSRKTERVYHEVVEEYRKVRSFFTPEEIEQMQDIQ
jgi:hypothetical protein